MRMLWPHAAKSPCLLSTSSPWQAAGKLEDATGSGNRTELAQSRGIFSSPIKAVCRVHQVSQYQCKYLLTATLGTIRVSLLICLSEAGVHSDDQNIPAMSRNLQTVEDFFENARVQFVKRAFHENASLQGKKAVFLSCLPV